MEFDTVVVGDCLDVMAEMPDRCVDLIYADMVYDALDFAWLDECQRILKNNGSIYVQTDYRSAAQVKLYLDNLFAFRGWIVWCYKAHPTRMPYYQRKHDDIFFYTQSDSYTWNTPTQKPSALSLARFRTGKNGEILNPTPSMKRTGTHYIRDVVCRDWWDDIPVPSGFSPWDTGKKVHKWQKPIKLLKRIILASSNEGDLIFDPFIGSGTSSAVALKLGRHFYGCDINPDYVKLANERIEKARLEMSQLSFLEKGKEWPSTHSST